MVNLAAFAANVFNVLKVLKLFCFVACSSALSSTAAYKATFGIPKDDANAICCGKHSKERKADFKRLVQ